MPPALPRLIPALRSSCESPNVSLYAVRLSPQAIQVAYLENSLIHTGLCLALAKDSPPWMTEEARDSLSTAIDLLKMMPTRQTVTEEKLTLAR
ncbi:hypothetical protein GJ744_001137 [Endocarpon pusillum]|uniref:Uncharacterized protein n=1 Tax=Endocarpon pusillum TaxID=364733 RepID=A0A8H7AAH9_9EURO|nr:hypothetical protein GJ744_001137 [Endocarpon pusillum]